MYRGSALRSKDRTGTEECGLLSQVELPPSNYRLTSECVEPIATVCLAAIGTITIRNNANTVAAVDDDKTSSTRGPLAYACQHWFPSVACPTSPRPEERVRRRNLFFGHASCQAH